MIQILGPSALFANQCLQKLFRNNDIAENKIDYFFAGYGVENVKTEYHQVRNIHNSFEE